MELDQKPLCRVSAPSSFWAELLGLGTEVVQVCLGEPEVSQVVCSAAEDFSKGTVPTCVAHAFTMTTVTSLQRRDWSPRNRHGHRTQVTGGQNFGTSVR